MVVDPDAVRGGLSVAIHYDPADRTFHLRNEWVSYLIGIAENGTLMHLYLGPALAPGRSYAHLTGSPFQGFGNRLGEFTALEIPTYGLGDYRVPAITVEQPDGSTVLELAYASHRILPGKPSIPGLPSTYVEADDEAETLEIVLLDGASGTEVRRRTRSSAMSRRSPGA